MKLTSKQYLLPYILITSLFFLWGFARAILDVLNQHFRESMHISITESSMIQVTTYLAYFLTAIPAGMFISRFGYRKGVVMGLMLYAAGALLFIPGAAIGTLPAFLVCLFIIGVGLTFLETSANPYATLLGPAETGTSRLNLSQSFNGLGCALAPLLLGNFLFSGGDVTVPYMLMGVVVIAVALIFTRVKLPEVVQDDAAAAAPATHSTRLGKAVVFGFCALLAYEVAEISINSYFVMFLAGEGVATNVEAAHLLSLALFIFMGGRFLGAWVMKYVAPARVLLACAAGSVACMCGVLMGGKMALYALIANFAFEAIMFPTIFSLTLSGLDAQRKKRASSYLMMTPVGGCAFLLMGLIADHTSLILPFIIPLAGFLTVLAFAIHKTKRLTA
ncbi:MAG: MFS transporter [Bacteroidales bacterium]|nr:MFS transporter [Bacteroidales bacterium]